MKTPITFNKLITIADKFDVDNFIYGEGSFGLIYKGRLKSKANQNEYAIKVFKSSSTQNEQAFNQIYRELYVQAGLNHVGIVPIVNYQLMPKNEGNVAIVTPFMENGSLHELLSAETEKAQELKQKWNGTTKAINVFGITAAMAYIHQNGIIHRDLKTENILLDDKMEPNICDFGLAKPFDDQVQAQCKQTMLIGTQIYMAPELIDGNGSYGYEIDVFAYSMVLYEIFMNHFPYYDQNFHIMKFILGNIRPTLKESEIPSYFYKLINKCWSSDPTERPTFAQITKEMYDNFEDIFSPQEFGEDVDLELLDDYMEKAIQGLQL